MMYGRPFLTCDLFFDEDANTLLKHMIDMGSFQQELQRYGEQVLPRPQENLKNPQVDLGGQKKKKGALASCPRNGQGHMRLS